MSQPSTTETPVAASRNTLQRPNLPALTGLRFLLALLIVCEHQSGPQGMLQLASRPIAEPLVELFRSGYAAVSFFFMLSGFVLAYGYDLAQRWDATQRRRFYVARVARIYPVYLLGLVLTLPLVLRTMRAEALQHAVLRWAPLLLAPALLQSWLPSAAGIWNGPGWSLSDEAFFYALLPLAGYWLWKIRSTAATVLAALGLWLGMLALLVTLAWRFDPLLLHAGGATFVEGTRWVAVLNFNPLLNVPEFLCGVLTAKIFLRLQEGDGWLRPGRGAWLYLPALVVELALLGHAARVPYVLMHGGLLLPVHAALMVGLGLGGGVVPRALASRPLLLLGQSSYALYLIHGPVKAWWLVLAAHWPALPVVGYTAFVAYAGLSVALSVVVFLGVEEPARRWVLRRWGTRRPRVHTVMADRSGDIAPLALPG